MKSNYWFNFMKSSMIRKIIIIFSFIFIFFHLLNNVSNNMDFYWNFNVSLQITKGLIPYRDISVIVPFLYHLLGSLFLLFNNHAISFCFYMTFLMIFDSYIIAKITELLSSEKYRNNLFILSYSFSIIILTKSIFEYNSLAILFLLLIIFCELSIKNNKYKELYIGVLVGLSILSKQSVGFVILLVSFFKIFLFNDGRIKCILLRLLGLFIPLTFFLFYLVFTNSLDAFFSYTLFGLKDFNNDVSFLTFLHCLDETYLKFLYFFLFIIFVMFIIYMVFNFFKEKDKSKKIVFLYCLASFSCFYPRRDGIHFIYMITPFIVFISLIINNFILKLKNRNVNCIKYVLFCFLLVYFLFPLARYCFHSNNYIIFNSNYKYYEGLLVKKSIKEQLDFISKFIDDSKSNVIILDYSGAFYHINQDIYFKDYDIFMRGNFGLNGEDRLIEDIINSKNTIYLIHESIGNENEMSQTPKNVINYVIDNFSKEGKVLEFNIYRKK